MPRRVKPLRSGVETNDRADFNYVVGPNPGLSQLTSSAGSTSQYKHFKSRDLGAFTPTIRLVLIAEKAHAAEIASAVTAMKIMTAYDNGATYAR